MPKLQPIRGTRDILPEERSRFRHIEEIARELALRYGYLETATPILEFSEVFKKTLGETSDVVKKEMYTFTFEKYHVWGASARMLRQIFISLSKKNLLN